MKRLLTFITLTALSLNVFAQKPADIFAEGKEYIYQVAFIQSNGDTLTNEKLIMLGNDDDWQFQKKQSIIEYKYFPDTVNLKKYIDPRAAYEERKVKNLKKKAKGKRRWDNYTWIDDYEITGKVITDSSFWLHPPRSNQYGYHYMNVYTEINFNQLFLGGAWKSNLTILRGFPSNEEFVGARIDTFEVTEKLSIDFNKKTLNDCWRIEITSTHSKQGATNAEFIFSETHGFLKMDYLFYDGVRINYVLKDIVVSEQ